MTQPVSELTNDELSKWIAGKIEPNPPITDDDLDFDDLLWHTFAVGKFHVWLIDSSKLRIEARDMVEDSDMTVMLLCELIKRGFDLHSFDRAEDSEFFRQVAFADTNSNLSVKRPLADFGRAVAEAFALANGYEE